MTHPQHNNCIFNQEIERAGSNAGTINGSVSAAFYVGVFPATGIREKLSKSLAINQIIWTLPKDTCDSDAVWISGTPERSPSEHRTEFLFVSFGNIGRIKGDPRNNMRRRRSSTPGWARDRL